MSPCPPAAARRNHAVALSLVRRVLDPPARSSLIETTGRTFRLRLRERDQVDSETYAHVADAALVDGGTDALEHAARLWAGEPLPEHRYAPWATAWREDLTDRYVSVLGRLARRCAERDDHAGAIRAARTCVEVDPLDERWQRELIAAYARDGRTDRALRQYEECRHALMGALGVEPAEATTLLRRRVLAGEL